MATIANGQKFLTSAPEANTTYGGPTSLKELNTWYTMQDITNTLQPYKSIILTGISAGGTTIYGYNVLENTLGDFTLTFNNGYLTLHLTEYEGINVDFNKVYLNILYTFSPSALVTADLEESGASGGYGDFIFVVKEMPAFDNLPYIDSVQIELRIYN